MYEKATLYSTASFLYKQNTQIASWFYGEGECMKGKPHAWILYIYHIPIYQEYQRMDWKYLFSFYRWILFSTKCMNASKSLYQRMILTLTHLVSKIIRA